MAVNYVSGSVYSENSGAGNVTGSFSLTNASGNDRLVCVLAALGDSQTDFANFTGCTFNGVSGTSITSENDTGTNKVESQCWYFKDADLPSSSGSYNVVVSSDDSSTDVIKCVVVELTGVDQTTSIADFASNQAWAPSASLGLTDYGDLAFDVLAVNRPNELLATFTATSGQTVIANDQSSGAARTLTIGASRDTSGPFTWTSDQSSNSSTHIAFSVNASAASLAIDTAPSTLYAVDTNTVTISGSTSAPTTGNTTVKLDGSTGVSGTVTAVTDNGDGSYDVDFTFARATARKFDATGYTLYIDVDGENVTSSAIPYLPPSGSDYVDVGTIDTGAQAYTDYTGGTIVTGDQWVWSNSPSLSFTDDLNFVVTGTLSATVYRISSAGTVDVENTMSFTLGNNGIVTAVVSPMVSNLVSSMVN